MPQMTSVVQREKNAVFVWYDSDDHQCYYGIANGGKINSGTLQNNLRDALSSATFTYMNSQLCYFDGSSETVVAENVSAIEVANQNGVLIYRTQAPTTGPKVKMSALNTYNPVKRFISSIKRDLLRTQRRALPRLLPSGKTLSR